MTLKKTFIILFILATSINVCADESLIKLITERAWDKIPENFLDNSYTILKENFTHFIKIKIEKGENNRLFYKSKFKNQGELGVITYEIKESKYSNLKIINKIRPLYFIEKFRKYRASNIKITVGEAKIHFIHGYFYEASPYNSMLIFKGKWNFYIMPSDIEERLTIKRQYRKNYFSKSNSTGVFFLRNREFLERLTLEGDTREIDPELESIYNFCKTTYGVRMEDFGQHWYLPFPKESNFIIFNKNNKSYYFYFFNSTKSPDTQLTLSDSEKLILSYNSIKNLKFSFGTANRASKIKMNLFLKPEENLISGTTTISYANKSSMNILRLARGLRLFYDPKSEAENLNLFKRGNSYCFSGASDKTFTFSFSGYIKPDRRDLELFKLQKEVITDIRKSRIDEFYYLSRIQNFYPNPGNDFFKTDITINLPYGQSCLAVGNLKSKKIGKITTYNFKSSGTKGISLVAGNFKPTKKINAKIPVKFYNSDIFKYHRKISHTEIKKAINLFVHTFGNLDLNEINVLLKKDLWEGGNSCNGFVIMTVPVSKSGFMTSRYKLDQLEEKPVSNPIILRNRVEDHIIHELAHQWWGGVVSWKSYQDVWITEGLAHFSVLYYIKKKSHKKYNKVAKNLKRWIYRHKNAGPVVYGTRIQFLENSYEAYQSIIYDKSALILLMLMDLIGEKDFFERLRSVLDEFRYKSITTMQFIKKFSGKNDLILNFLKQWIFSRETPVVKLELAEDNVSDNKKEVILLVKQLNTDFIFPLKLKITTYKGSTIEPVVIRSKNQRIRIKRNSVIRSINIVDSIAPIKEKKESYWKR